MAVFSILCFTASFICIINTIVASTSSRPPLAIICAVGIVVFFVIGKKLWKYEKISNIRQNRASHTTRDINIEITTNQYQLNEELDNLSPANQKYAELQQKISEAEKTLATTSDQIEKQKQV